LLLPKAIKIAHSYYIFGELARSDVVIAEINPQDILGREESLVHTQSSTIGTPQKGSQLKNRNFASVEQYRIPHFLPPFLDLRLNLVDRLLRKLGYDHSFDKVHSVEAVEVLCY
jgi:hypothetical protein